MASQLGEGYTRMALRNAVICFLLAGRETTSSAVTWFFWLPSSRLDVARRPGPGRGAGRGRRTFSRTTRRWGRGGSCRTTHRRWGGWSRCAATGEGARAYRPERWLDPAEGTFRSENPFRNIGFHAGPRMCLGKEMALKSIVACVVEEFKLAVDGEYTPRQMASLTLRMADGLPVVVKAFRAYIFQKTNSDQVLFRN
ncbi:hypothetical protein ZWY2020_024306 [Hordeum vulgare]|nr:hypothetical protein ZWY2020_024306 [Hordeum vulgare]